MPRVALLSLLLLTGCAAFPEVETVAAGFGEGPAPILLPTDDLLARVNQPTLASEATLAAMQARVAQLKARAALLRARPSA